MKMAHTDAETVICNGVKYDVIEHLPNGTLAVRRPNGVKVYIASRLPDSPLYGGNRGHIEPSFS